MGRRGIQPRPARLRLLEGAQASKVNHNEPIPRDGKMEPPPGMSRDVLLIFQQAVKDLEHMRIASPADCESLAAYAEAVDKHRKASALLAKSPLLVQNKRDGGLIRNPVLQIQRDSAHLIRMFAQEFGLTPSARARIKADEALIDESENPFAQGG